MWTPRRVVLLLGGLLLSAGVYGVYGRFFGWLDGLPQLPARMLNQQRGVGELPARPTSPTILRLREAFGPDCPEQQTSLYPTQLEFRSGETSVVLASGSPPFNPETESKRVVLAPFSVAVFGAPKPAHLRQPGEVAEISTFHADKAVLEFDRPVVGPTDMARAKLLRMELVSEPDPNMLKLDPRCGVVHVTNNQRSADPNKFLVLRTVGPVFYRDPKAVTGPADGPDIWTDAAVELVNRQNLPRGAGAPAPPTGPATGPDIRTDTGVVPAILAGRRLPPPTLTGLGMRIFFEPDSPRQPGTPPPKKAAGPGGLKRVEILEKVLIHLWVDAQQQVMAPAGPARDEPAKPTGPQPVIGIPTAAAVGGVVLGVQDARLLNRALVQVDTRGSLSYDAEASVAHFDAGPGNPNVPNDVEVHRIPPTGIGTQRMFSQKLDIEFFGPATGPGTTPPPKTNKPAEAGSPSFKRLVAWVEAPGRLVSVSSETDRLEAYGQRLEHDQVAGRTILVGESITVTRENPPREDKKRAGSNKLTAGAPHQKAVLTIESGTGPDKTTTITVKGRGKLELFDPAANASTVQARWETSLVQTRETVNRRDLDLFTFTDGAVFEDTKADYWLKGKVLKLWMENGSTPVLPDPTRKPTESRGQVPSRLQATGDVTGHSAELDIEQADNLNVLFRDTIPPPQPAAEPAGPPAAQPQRFQPSRPAPPAGAPAAPPVPGAAPVEPPLKEPEKPKPPIRVKARTVDTWVVRYPLPPAPPAPRLGAPPGVAEPAPKREEGSTKYELEKARCEGPYTADGRAVPLVHQDPAEPAPDKRGLDIYGQTMLLDHTPDGSVLTVTGADERRPGQVHHEGTSIIGMKVVLDQLHNTAEVEGRGSLVMPSSSDLGGADLKQASVVVVHWRDAMKFRGATKLAEFFGKVTAQQNDSYVTCHTLQVQFDRPVDFSPRKKAAPSPAPAGPRVTRFDGAAPPPAPPAAKENPKIEVVRCYPAPDDARDEPQGAKEVTYHEVIRDATGKVAKTQHLTAQDLEMTTRPLAPGAKENIQEVLGKGPGTLRIWQPGDKDAAGPPAGGAPKPAPVPGDPPAKESEMKLTVVQFAGRMRAVDRGKVYQEATFTETIEVIHAPADQPDALVDRHRLPRGSVRLTCADRLVVSAHKKANAPVEQRMDAYGNAYIRSDEYDGMGETITSDGPTVTLKGGKVGLAHIKNLYSQTESSGQEIVYNRLTGALKLDGSTGTTIQGSPTQPAPPPPAPMRPGIPGPGPVVRPGPTAPRP